MTLLLSPVSLLCALLGTAPVSGLFSGPDCYQPRLELSVTVNGRPSAPDPLIRTGGQVRVVYRLTNPGYWDIDDIHLTAPAGVAGTIVCPSGNAVVPELEDHSSVVCVGTLSAAAVGSHEGTVTVTGQAGYPWWHGHEHGDGQGGGEGDGQGDGDGHGHGHDWDWPVTASAPVGYRGVGGLISATDSVSVTPTATGGRATFTYTVTNTGNLPVYGFSLSDPLVPAGGISCTGVSAGLAPGAVAHCDAVANLAPGAHRSTLSVTASDQTSTAGSDGGTVPPPTLTASATAGFTVVALPPPPPTPTPTPTPTPVPPRPTPTPTPTPTPPRPTPRPTPTPTPPPPPTPTTPTPTPPPPSTPPPPPPTHKAPPPPTVLAQMPRPGMKTPLFLIVMMVPAAGAAAVLAARRK